MGKLIIKERVICPRCKGKGRVFDVEECVCTGGIMFALELIWKDLRAECPECDGDGWIYKTTEVIEEE